MKIRILIFSIALTGLQLIANGQITTRTVAAKEKEVEPAYDSLTNELYNSKKFIGQKIFILPKSKLYPDYGKYPGYGKFTLDTIKSTSQANIYKPVARSTYYVTDETAVSGKTFLIQDVCQMHEYRGYGDTWPQDVYLKLLNTETNEKCYYRLGGNEEILIVGHFEKLKKLNVGQEITQIEAFYGLNDINTGKPATTKIGSGWKVVDMTLIETQYEFNVPALIIRDSINTEVAIYGSLISKYKKVSTLKREKEEARLKALENEKLEKQEAAEKAKQDKIRKDALIKKYGANYGQKIFEGEVEVGMTKQMVTDAWGDPSDINSITDASGSLEQWVYGGSYLYFKNGLLKTIQNF